MERYLFKELFAVHHLPLDLTRFVHLNHIFSVIALVLIFKIEESAILCRACLHRRPRHVFRLLIAYNEIPQIILISNRLYIFQGDLLTNIKHHNALISYLPSSTPILPFPEHPARNLLHNNVKIRIYHEMSHFHFLVEAYVAYDQF